MVKPREHLNFGSCSNVVEDGNPWQKGRILKLLCFEGGANRNVFLARGAGAIPPWFQIFPLQVAREALLAEADAR